MRKLTAGLAVLALAAGAAGCGDEEGDANEPAPGAQAATAPSGPVGSKGNPIGMRNLRFDPEKATARAGEAIHWVNSESIQHNVVAEEGADFESELLDQGETYEFTPKSAGTIRYVCTLHPGMDGTITVEG